MTTYQAAYREREILHCIRMRGFHSHHYVQLFSAQLPLLSYYLTVYRDALTGCAVMASTKNIAGPFC
jgi:hypothetical protein